jgi:glutaredoxin
LSKEAYVEVIGVNPPCMRCQAAWRSAEKAASILKSEGVEVRMKKLDIMSKEVISKYGAIMSPALALNGIVKIMGRVPEAKEVETLLRELIK